MNILKFIICLTFVIMLSAPSYAGTAITDDIANKYFENCVTGAQKQGTMTPNTQKRYCACTAMNMQQSLTQEDLSALSAQDDAARLVLNKILLNVNGPCMQYPVHDLIEKKCMTDLKNAGICSCLSNKMGQYTAQQSQKLMPKLLADNPNLFDPLTPIMESQEFQQTQHSIALSCATNPNQ